MPAQTIKQAKAAFNKRGRPSLSEREQKQLQRSIELDRRAWRSKEQEKRKAEALRKRQEKEKKEREEQTKIRMGTQILCDRFGYKSSQFHLGAFFKKHGVDPDSMMVCVDEFDLDDGIDDEVFEDGGVDDEVLLSALRDPAKATQRPTHPQSDSAALAMSTPAVVPTRSVTEPPTSIADELSSFWDELESSTQIARELGDDKPVVTAGPTVVTPAALTTATTTSSFGADDFDITIEDLEELEKPEVATVKAEMERKLMPPPALPSRVKSIQTGQPVPVQRQPTVTTFQSLKVAAPRGQMVSGFSLSELEAFVDDDLQLTQAAIG